MNKKAVSESVIVIAILLIFLMIVAAIFFFPNALLPKIAKVTKGFERFLPGKPKTEIPPGLNAPKEITEIFNSLYNAFNNAKGKGDCYVKYTSLNMGDYTIKLEYSNQEKGTYMRLLNEKQQLVSDHFVSGIQPCIALPDKNKGIKDVKPLDQVDIKNNNKIYYSGSGYDLFSGYPLLYKPKDNNLVCFFTDDRVKDPIDGKWYGTEGIWNWEGFNEEDMKERMEKGRDCSQPKICEGQGQIGEDCICNSEMGWTNKEKPWFSFEPPCAHVSQLFCKGSGQIGADCICDASQGWTNEEKPWFSFEPLCIKRATNEYAIDPSLYEGNEEDKGICIAYYSLKDFFTRAKTYPFAQIVIELAKYDMEEGYINKVDETTMESVKTTPDYRDAEITRKKCYQIMGSHRTAYGIFYTEGVNNLQEGCIDDKGYCVSFDPQNNNKFVSVIKESATREECIEIEKSDPTYKYSFFIVTKGSKECQTVQKEGAEMQEKSTAKERKISIHYSPDIPAKQEEEDLSEEYIKNTCNQLENYDLTFITGVLYPSGSRQGQYGGENEYNRKSACMYEISFLYQNKRISNIYNYIKSTEIGDQKNICCYAENPNLK